MKETIPSQHLSLSKDEKIFLIDEMLPKEKRGFLLIACIFIVLTFIAPYLPGKFGQKPLIEKMSYGNAVLWFGLFFSLITYYAYRYIVLRLRRDINEGYKYVYQIERKIRINNDQYELRLELKPNKIKKIIFLKRPECYDWQKGDIIEVEYLKYTGKILSLKNNTKNQVYNFIN